MSESAEEKLRSGCKRDSPLTSFASDRNRRDGLQPRCRECVAAYGAAHHRRRRAAEGEPHGEWHRNSTATDGLATRCKACKAIQGRAGRLKRRYGMTEAQRDDMLSSQSGVCTICPVASALHVDHCHKTGRVRGVVCFNCNSAIGKLGDDPDSLRRAIAYLEGNAWKPTLVAPGVYQLPS
ncbi:endonuclease VII domain-containing protein [Streptomyces sp. NPDC048565]|uniref:endonuclease VII domain-containing protein n=1 Tax=Streptomyces sp. NPDC048565 TaxID=3155266 RepID=UPI003431E6AE